MKITVDIVLSEGEVAVVTRYLARETKTEPAAIDAEQTVRDWVSRFACDEVHGNVEEMERELREAREEGDDHEFPG